MSAFGGKADMTRTYPLSASDPKRTSPKSGSQFLAPLMAELRRCIAGDPDHRGRLNDVPRIGHQPAVRVTSSSSFSSGTKPLPPHVGHCRSSSVPFSMTPSPLHSGQVFVFTCASLWIPL